MNSRFKKILKVKMPSVMFHEIFLQEPVIEEAIGKIERTVRQVSFPLPLGFLLY